MATQTQKNVSFPTVVNLNVGGQLYTTSLSILTKYSESMLGAMFSGRFAAQKDSNGNYFIDRDGALFRYVLAFLRNGEMHVPENFNEFGLLLKEAEFYQIPVLTQTVKQQMEGQGGQKSHKQDEKETITVFGRDEGSRRKPYMRVLSISGRLRTLTEIFQIADHEEGEPFEITPYAINQSDQTYNERMGKITPKNSRSVGCVENVLKIVQLHGFKETKSCVLDDLPAVGDSYWVLTRN